MIDLGFQIRRNLYAEPGFHKVMNQIKVDNNFWYGFWVLFNYLRDQHEVLIGSPKQDKYSPEVLQMFGGVR